MTSRLVLTVLAAVAIVAAPGQARAPDQRDTGSATPLTLTIVKRQLSNGLQVRIVEQHELPVVQMSLLVPIGTDADPPGRYGIAGLTSAMLTEGAGARSATAIADALDGLLANLSASCGVDSCSVQLYVPVGHLAEALPIMADVSLRPTFPKQELERVRQQRLGALLNARDDPDSIAALAFARGIYGPSDRKAAAQIGTADSIKALTAADLESFHYAVYRPGNSTLIVVGDVESDQVIGLLEAHFGKWQAATARGGVDKPAPPRQRPPRQLTLIDMPGAPQSRILIGGVSGSSSMSDLFPIQVLNTILRGRFASGRNATLRDYTSGVRLGFDMRKSASPFVVAAAAQSDKTADSVRELLSELTGVLKGLSTDELARAKDDIAVQFPRTFQATGRISTRLKAVESLVVYGLPDDYYSTYMSAIRAVGPGDVQRIAEQYIQPDQLEIVIVGDRNTIAPRLRLLGVGAVKEVSIDELFAPGR
jgi:zinc protease